MCDEPCLGSWTKDILPTIRRNWDSGLQKAYKWGDEEKMRCSNEGFPKDLGDVFKKAGKDKL